MLNGLNMETVACDLCGCESYTPVVTQTDLIHRSTDELFTIVACDQCGLNYTNPRPTRDAMKQFYSESYSFHQTKGLKAFVKRSVLGALLRRLANSPFGSVFFCVPFFSSLLGSQVRPLLADPVLSHLDKKHTHSFLDIGCGSGLDPHFWREKSSLVTISKKITSFGIEPDPVSRKFLNSNGIQCWSDLDEVQEKITFDLIRLNWSLEHVHEPSRYFSFISERLSTHGRVVIAVPNYSGLIFQLAPDCVELPIHLYHFTEDHLSAYADKYGLEVINVTTFSYPGMFSFSSRVGLITSPFPIPKGITQAKEFQKFLNIFDAAGLGNDIIVEMKRKTT